MLKYFHFIPESFLAFLVSFSNWFLEFPIKRLYCVGRKAPPLSCSCWFITFIKLLVMGQMWCANTLSLSSQLAPRVQYSRPVFVRAEWHGDLWSVKPPCLWRIPAFTSVFPVFNSVAWWHTVPVSPEMVLGPCGKEWRVVPPFERRETKLWMRNQGRRGKWVTMLCLCGTHSIRPRGGTAGPVQRGGDTAAPLQYSPAHLRGKAN